MSQRVGVIVFYHFRFAGSAGGEVYQHQVMCLGACFAGGTCKFCGELFHFLVEVPPALVRAAHYDLVLNAGHRGLSLVHLLQYILVVQTYHGVDLCTVSAVDQVFLCQLQRTRDQNGTDLVQSHCTNPVLPAAAENQHDNSSLFDAKALEIVGCLVGQAGNVRECEHLFFAGIIAPDQGFLFRLLLCPFVYNVKTEVEVVRNVDTIICFEILVTVKIDTRQIFVEQHMQMLLFCSDFSAWKIPLPHLLRQFFLTDTI